MIFPPSPSLESGKPPDKTRAYQRISSAFLSLRLDRRSSAYELIPSAILSLSLDRQIQARIARIAPYL